MNFSKPILPVMTSKAMKYHIYHSTEFSYQHQVSFSHNLIRLKPRDTAIQKLLDFSLNIDPKAGDIEEYDDFFGNHLHHISIREPHHALKVIAKSTVHLEAEGIELLGINREKARGPSMREVLEKMKLLTPQTLDARQYVLRSPLIGIASNELEVYAKESITPERSCYDGVHEFMGRIFEDFSFVSGFSDVNTPVQEVFDAKKGVCQDFAHLAITALRTLGLPARYMSGYIETTPPEGKEKLFGSDASHAWFSVFIPGFGWFDFDPTNNIVPMYQHLLLGYGRDYSDISPMQGVVQGSGSSHLKVMVDVTHE